MFRKQCGKLATNALNRGFFVCFFFQRTCRENGVKRISVGEETEVIR